MSATTDTGVRRRSRLVLVAALLVVAAVLAAFGPPPEGRGNEGELVALAASPPDSLDPGVAYAALSWQLLVNAYDGLLTYRKTAGPGATELVPDLAAAMPTMSDGGRTLTFTMRRGVRFGAPANREVLPSDIAYTIERNVRMPSLGGFYYDVIAGVDAVKAGRTTRIAGIVADDDARTITFRLTRPDATFLNVLALPFSFAVPKGTPLTDQSTHGFTPATGPYQFIAFDPQRHIRMERNPAFRQWSPHTPRGVVDRITVKLGVSPDNAVTLVLRGKADAMLDPVPRSRLPGLLADDGTKELIHQEELARTAYLWMNTTVPPFDRPQVRQALNWAIDRRAIVKLTGGQGVPTSNILPPSMPGFAEHRLYPRRDIERARELVRASGVRPGRVTVWSMTSSPGPEIAQYVQDQLRQLGFTATIRQVDNSTYRTLIGAKATGAQIGYDTWTQDFPEGANFIDVLLNGAHIRPQQTNNFAFYSGHDRQIAEVNAELDPKRRAAAWGRLDREIVEAGAWAPLMHGVSYQLVSERLGGYAFHPTYQMLLSQATLDDG